MEYKQIKLIRKNKKYKDKNGHTRTNYIWLCPYCNNEFIALKNAIESGRQKSCGCQKLNITKQKITKHGKHNTNLYKTLVSIKGRCYNEKDPSFKNYGGRGISVCEEWKNNFINFYNWCMDNGYKKGLTIDRIDVNGNYEPNNCRFVDRFIQNRNTRKIQKNNTSGYRGVTSKKNGRFRAGITVNNKPITLGTYAEARHAGMAYDTFVIVNGLEHTRNFD